MARYRHIRKKRGTAWTSESSAQANRARWTADRARRDAEQPAREREMAIIEARNLPRREGDPVGILQFTNLRDGTVRRWTLRIGDRADRFTCHSPDGRATQSHGLTWLFIKLRSAIVRNH